LTYFPCTAFSGKLSPKPGLSALRRLMMRLLSGGARAMPEEPRAARLRKLMRVLS
jgi:hypothetical protein